VTGSLIRVTAATGTGSLLLALALAAPAQQLAAQSSVAWLPRVHAFEAPLADPLAPRFGGLIAMSDLFTRPLVGHQPGVVRDADLDDPEPQALAVLGGIMPMAGTRLAGCSVTASVEAVVLARFRLRNTQALSNDWWAALPVAAACGRGSAQLRLFHRSDHLNDEFLIHNNLVRRGPVQDGVDLTLSWRHSPDVRVYAGGGHLLRSWGPHGSMLHGGVELGRLLRPGVRLLAAAHLRGAEASGWRLQRSISMGVEYRGRDGALRVALMDLRGPSTLGEFYRSQEQLTGLEFTVKPGASRDLP
jgi:hypothetical protein